MKKTICAAILNFVCAFLCVAFALFVVLGLTAGDLAKSDRAGTDGLGYGIGLIVVVPLLIFCAIGIAVAAVPSCVAGVHLLAKRKGKKVGFASVAVAIVFKLIAVGGSVFAASLLFSLDNGAAHGICGVLLCVFLLCSVLFDFLSKKEKREGEREFVA